MDEAKLNTYLIGNFAGFVGFMLTGMVFLVVQTTWEIFFAWLAGGAIAFALVNVAIYLMIRKA